MDYAELKRKFEYTDPTINIRQENGFTTAWDVIADEEDMNRFHRSVITDFRPDPRTMEEDQKQTRTDNVSVLRLHYHGIRTGDDPDYHKELFLEDTEKDPRRSFTDPDFREAAKQSWARQEYLVRNLYPEDPLTGSITQGTKSQYGMTILALEGRHLSMPRYKSVLEDTLDGYEPRRMYNRYDNYSYIDKALANQGDLPFVLSTTDQYGNQPFKAMPLADGSGIVWTDGDVTLQVAKLGRSATAHRSAEDYIRMGANQLHKPDSFGAEKSRVDSAADDAGNMIKRNIVVGDLIQDITKIVDDAKHGDSTGGKSTNGGIAWGSVQENIRALLNMQQTQEQRFANQNDKTGRGVALGNQTIADGGYNKAVGDTKILLEQYKEALTKYNLPMSSMKGNIEIAQQVQRELANINENWQMEKNNLISKTKTPVGDDIQKSLFSAESTKPWNETAGRVLEVVNFKINRMTDGRMAQSNQIKQETDIISATDKTGPNRRLLHQIDATNPGSLLYESDRGVDPNIEIYAAAGSMGGIAAPLTSKQGVRFKVDEKDEWIVDKNTLSG